MSQLGRTLSVLALGFVCLSTPVGKASASSTGAVLGGLSHSPIARTVTIEPLSGPVGTQVKVGGSGFNVNSSISLKYDGKAADSPSTSTGDSGTFALTFVVPASSSGNHTIEVSDGFNVGTQSFIVTPAATVNPQSGYAGMQISLAGSGFASGETAFMYFDGVPAGKAVVRADGSLETFLTVPPRLAGTYTIKVTDGASTRELGFAVITSVSMNPVTSQSAPGFVGEQITVGGVGFVPGKTLTVDYDMRSVATSTVSPDSNFSVAFIAPPSTGGQHSVTVSDGVNTLTLKFFMEATSPPAPTLIEPAVGNNERPQVTFKWSSVPDPSGVAYRIQIATSPNFDQGSIVLDRATITATEYKLVPEEKLKPARRTNPYFWRVDAVDGASNVGTWSNTSYFTVGTPTPSWVLWMFIGLGGVIVVLFGFWLGRRTSSRPVPGSMTKEKS